MQSFENLTAGVLNPWLFFIKSKKRINEINGFKGNWGECFIKSCTNWTAHLTAFVCVFTNDLQSLFEHIICTLCLWGHKQWRNVNDCFQNEFTPLDNPFKQQSENKKQISNGVNPVAKRTGGHNAVSGLYRQTLSKLNCLTEWISKKVYETER